MRFAYDTCQVDSSNCCCRCKWLSEQCKCWQTRCADMKSFELIRPKAARAKCATCNKQLHVSIDNRTEVRVLSYCCCHCFCPLLALALTTRPHKLIQVHSHTPVADKRLSQHYETFALIRVEQKTLLLPLNCVSALGLAADIHIHIQYYICVVMV